ncbi:MAG: hypothetical protein ACPGLV_18810 [Bacteroidia bacterium]
MIKSAIIFLMLFVSAQVLFAQTPPRIEIVEGSFGIRFEMNGKKLSPRQLKNAMSDYPKASAEMKIAKRNYKLASVFTLPGGYFIGYPIGTHLAGGEANWRLLGVGVGLVVVSFPFYDRYKKHAIEAVKIYNKERKE